MGSTMQEMQTLRSTISSLLLELEERKSQSRCSGTRGSSSAAAGGGKKKWQLRDELECAQYRLAELEELECVEAAKKKAIDLGLVECLVEKPKVLEECPLCRDEIPNVHPADFGKWQLPRLFHRLYCCGAICCMRCITRRNNNILREFQEFQTLDRVPNDDEMHYMVELKHRMKATGTCPFCRSKNFGVEHMISLLRGHVEKNKSWACYELGEMLRFGLNGAKKDQREAAKLLELAADSGDMLAMIQMGYVWVDGFPDDDVPPCKEKTMEFYLRAARQGHFLAQYQVGHALDPDDEDERMWYMLSAAQGYTLAQCVLGENYHHQYVYDRDVHGTNDPATLFKAVYWWKQAAIQGYTKAQILLANVLLDSQDVYYSPIPEASFWFDLAVSKESSHEEKRPVELKLLRCGSCKKSEHGSAKLKCCTKCHGVRYCDRDCQAKHWKMGHKRDCAVVAACREALRVSPTADIQDQYPVSKTLAVESGAGGE